MDENVYIEESVSSGDLVEVETEEEATQTEEEATETEQEALQPVTYVIEDNSIDYSQNLEAIIELQTAQIDMLAQNNVNQLFLIGTLCAVFVCMLLHNAIKKLI